jgi:rod shape-determining protein MreC
VGSRVVRRRLSTAVCESYATPVTWKRQLAWVCGLWLALLLFRGLFLGPARTLLGIPLGMLTQLINPLADLPHYPQLRAENTILRHTVAQLTTSLVDTQALQAENARLRGLLALDQARGESRMVMARVIARDPLHWQRAVWINKGQRQGLSIGTPVVVGGGVVGKIVNVERHRAFVLLVTDPEVRVGALVSRTRDQGIVQGQGTQTLQLTYLGLETDVQPGDHVVTSGLGGIYPRGIQIGRVMRVETDASQLYRVAHLEPTAALGRLESVACLVNQ